VNTKLSAGVGEIIELMMAKKRDDRYPSTKELIADLEAVAAGEPPYQARKKYDHALLHDLATSGETVSMAAPEDLDPTAATDPTRSLVILLLAIALGLSILLNVALVIFGVSG
jgi:hypothetical protein